MPARRVPRSPLRWRTVLTVGFVLTLLAPALRSDDGLPLSSYSMYAYPRPAQVTFVVAVGIDSGGTIRPLSTRTIGATADPLIAESLLRNEVDAGRADELCVAIGARANDEGGAPIEIIEIRRESYHVVDRALDDQSPSESRVLAKCMVP